MEKELPLFTEAGGETSVGVGTGEDGAERLAAGGEAAAANPAPGCAVALPLAARMRPRCLGEVVGQRHLLGPGRLLRRLVEARRLGSVIFYGPPGTGKTSLARVIGRELGCVFEGLHGASATVADVRRVLAAAEGRRRAGGMTLLFLDEAHRFNRAQQETLLAGVEEGMVWFVGATTQNPFFALAAGLVSRSQVFALEPLGVEELLELERRALADEERGLGRLRIEAEEAALRHLAEMSDGDGRRCLNALEVAALTTPPDEEGRVRLTLEAAEQSIQRKAVVYDREDDAHYDTISAFIKSLRGGDPDAALYWLAKMLYAGEDMRFVARRMVIAASEDVGMADSRALLVAVAAQQALETVGLPEAQIPLAHAAVYLATAPKSNAAYAGLMAAREDVGKGRLLEVPPHLRDGSAAGSRRLGRGVGYVNPHGFAEGYVPQAYLPEGRRYYFPTERGEERRVGERLARWRAVFEGEGRGEQEQAGAG